MTRRVLITGATGGLGGALVREGLRRGLSVRATGRSATAGAALIEQGAEFVPADLTVPNDLSALLRGCDGVIHAAALSASWGPRQAFEAANVEATAALLRAAKAAGVRRFVFVSSPSIFAAFRDRLGIAPDDPPTEPPLNHYARTKLAGERMVLAADEGAFACAVVRPRALVGEGDRVILPRLAALAGRPRLPLPRGGRALIELTDLRDAAWAICELEARLPALRGRAVNVSGQQPVMVRTVATNLAAALGHAPRLLDVPVPLARAAASAMEAAARLRRSTEEPTLTRYTLATLAYSQTFDRSAEALLGYAAKHDALATLLESARGRR